MRAIAKVWRVAVEKTPNSPTPPTPRRLTCTPPPPPPLHPLTPTYTLSLPKSNPNPPPKSFLSPPHPRLMGPIVLATGLSVLAGAVLVKQVMDQNPMMGSGRINRCSTCNGTGRVTCLCTRWSDGDYGCRACAGSGRMACNSCGGTGTGRPIPVQIAVRPPSRPS